MISKMYENKNKTFKGKFFNSRFCFVILSAWEIAQAILSLFFFGVDFRCWSCFYLFLFSGENRIIPKTHWTTRKIKQWTKKTGGIKLENFDGTLLNGGVRWKGICLLIGIRWEMNQLKKLFKTSSHSFKCQFIAVKSHKTPRL